MAEEKQYLTPWGQIGATAIKPALGWTTLTAYTHTHTQAQTKTFTHAHKQTNTHIPNTHSQKRTHTDTTQYNAKQTEPKHTTDSVSKNLT